MADIEWLVALRLLAVVLVVMIWAGILWPRG
jgi:hypothetical protein